MMCLFVVLCSACDLPISSLYSPLVAVSSAPAGNNNNSNRSMSKSPSIDKPLSAVASAESPHRSGRANGNGNGNSSNTGANSPTTRKSGRSIFAAVLDNGSARSSSNSSDKSS